MTGPQKHKLAYLAFAACLILQGNAFAGSNTARLTCTPIRSEARLVRLEGDVPASIEDLNLKITLGAASTTLNRDNSDAYTVENLAKGVYTLTIRSKNSGGTSILYAVPSSVVSKDTPNGVSVKFLAYLDTPIPGRSEPVQSAADMLDSVRLTCTYLYEI